MFLLGLIVGIVGTLALVIYKDGELLLTIRRVVKSTVASVPVQRRISDEMNMAELSGGSAQTEPIHDPYGATNIRSAHGGR